MGLTTREKKLESEFQAHLIAELPNIFPGCIILKNDSAYQQGIPDLSVLWRDKWAFLEVKASATSEEQPNQRWFVEKANDLCFGAFIYPENEEEVIDGIRKAFHSARRTRVSQRQ